MCSAFVRCGFSLLLLLLVVFSSGFSGSVRQSKQLSVKIDLASLKVAPGKPIQGSVRVSVPFDTSSLRDPNIRVFLVTSRANATVESDLEKVRNLGADGLLKLIDDALGEKGVIQKRIGPVPLIATNQISVGLDQGGSMLPRVSRLDPRPVESGNVYVLAFAMLMAEDGSGGPVRAIGFGETQVEVVPGLKTIDILNAGVRQADLPVAAGQEVHLDYSYLLTGLSASSETPIRFEGAIVEKNPPAGQIPFQRNNWITKSIRGNADGEPMRRESAWRLTFPRPGEYEVTLEISAPGFVPSSATIKTGAQREGTTASKAVRKALVSVIKKTATAATPTQQPSPVYWVLDRTEVDPDKLEGKALYGGTINGVSTNGFTANHDQIQKISGGYAPNSVFKISASGSPPAKLSKGDKFSLTLTATGNKVGMDKCADGREPNQQASASVGATSAFKITATPRTNGMPSAIDTGMSVAVGGYGGGWYPSDTRTYTVEVVESPGQGEISVWGYFPGFGSFVRYVYKREDSKSPDAPDSTDGKLRLVLEPDEEYPALEAVLDPEVLDVSSRNAQGSAAALLIKGIRPDLKPVQVLIDAVDGSGTIRFNPKLRLNQAGSVSTAETSKAAGGTLRRSLTAFAELGVQPGLYTVPVIVRQDGHGEARLFLTLRISPQDAPETERPSPSTSGPARQSSFQAILSPEAITLKPLRDRVQVQVLLDGLDAGADKAIEVSFPQGDGGRLFGGLSVSPGGLNVLPGNLPVVNWNGQERRFVAFDFLAGPNAQDGEYRVEISVKQQGGAEVVLTLLVRVARSQ